MEAAVASDLPNLEADSFQIESLDGSKTVTFQHRKMPFMRAQGLLRTMLYGVIPGARLPTAHEEPTKFVASLVMAMYPATFDQALKAFFEFLRIKTDEDAGFGPLVGNERKLDGVLEGVDVFLCVMHCVGYHFLASLRDRRSLGLSFLAGSGDGAPPTTN